MFVCSFSTFLSVCLFWTVCMTGRLSGICFSFTCRFAVFVYLVCLHCLFVSLYVCLSLTACFSIVCQSVCWSVCLSICLSVSLFVCLAIHIFLYISTITLSVRLSVCLSVCLSVNTYIFKHGTIIHHCKVHNCN